MQTESWIPFLLELEPAALIVHGRIAKHLSKVPANWEEIGKAVKLRDEMKKQTLIIGNGDVQSMAEVREKHTRFGVDGVMVGRGIFHNLFVFDRQNPARSLHDLPPAERLMRLARHARLFSETWGERRDFSLMRKFFKIYASGFKGASELRAALMGTENGAEAEEVIRKWVEGPESGEASTTAF
jgi:tRNA-dihydrouridine synthase